jgi:hypothetical protein
MGVDGSKSDLARARAAPPQPPPDGRPELQHPAPDGFVGDVEPTLGEQLLDVSVAEREAQVEPDRGWMTTGGNRWRRYESSIIRSAYSDLPPWPSGYPDKAHCPHNVSAHFSRPSAWGRFVSSFMAQFTVRRSPRVQDPQHVPIAFAVHDPDAADGKGERAKPQAPGNWPVRGPLLQCRTYQLLLKRNSGLIDMARAG